jgi:WYL_2, Sm-like SH3 beta-barrel fold
MTNSVNTSIISPNFSLNNSKESIAALLRNCDATITFIKKDGTERAMKCTLREGVAVPYEKKTERTREAKDDILPVWDIEANGWRSVTVSSIQTIELI